MKDDIYSVNVSSLNIRPEPKINSRINLQNNTIVKETGKSKQHCKDVWIEVITISKPVVKRFVKKKYLRKI